MRHPSIAESVLVALLSIGFAGAAAAQAVSQPNSDTTRPAKETRSATEHSSRISHGDRKFIENATRSGIAEYELGKLAAQRAASPEVKQFAERMVSDHGKAGEQLREIAQQKGITMPDKPKHAESRERGKLAKLSGAQFDREYMDHMVKDHRKDVKEFEKVAQHAKDPEVKSFAQQTLPILQEHLQMAEQAQAAVGGATAQPRAKGKAGSQ